MRNFLPMQSHQITKKPENLYQEEDQYDRQTNFKKQQNSKPHRNQWRKQLLLHNKRSQG